MKLTELHAYQEEDDSEFTHDGVLYNLNKILTLTASHTVKMFDIEDLKWAVEDVTLEKARKQRADYSVPLLVTNWQGKWVVIDGTHRLAKALDAGIKELPVRIVSAKELEAARV